MERIPHFVVLWLAVLAAASGAAQEGHVLTLADARGMALQQHPRISAAELRTFAAQQDVIATRSALFPQVSANLTAVGNTREENRIAQSALTTSSAHDRVSAGLTVSQVITDFGRTEHLTQSARFQVAAENSNQQATRAQLVLQVDRAYFAVLQAQSLRRVAEETVKTRQLILDQTTALANNKLRSELDVNFAEVSLQEANLLVVRVQNDLLASLAVLRALLGCADDQGLRLVEEPLPQPISEETGALVEEALRNRPELEQLRCQRAAALRRASGERSLHYPSVLALGSVGAIPARSQDLNDYFAVGGVTMNLTLLDGCRINAKANEAEFVAARLLAELREAEYNIRRDVQVARLDVDSAAERLEVTRRLLEFTRRGFDLAQARYAVGASSIVELSQAQLSLTTADIGQTSAKYEYLARRAALDFHLGRLPLE